MLKIDNFSSVFYINSPITCKASSRQYIALLWKFK